MATSRPTKTRVVASTALSITAFHQFVELALGIDPKRESCAFVDQSLASRQFVERADPLAASSAQSPTVKKFSDFLEEARPLSVHLNKPSPAILFREFVEKGRPLLVARVKDLLPRIKERIALATRWLVPDDLLAIAGFSFVENSYTKLMEWALRPSTHRPSACARQRAWLDELGLLDRVGECDACEPLLWPRFDDGIPDMLLAFPDWEVIVEAKTGSVEHLTPLKKPQTVSYQRTDRSLVVFITTDRSKAANPSATLTTFVSFAMCLAEVLEMFELPVATRQAFAMLFTHFLTCATDEDIAVADLLGAIRRCAALPQSPDDDMIFRNRDDLRVARELFDLEADQ